jgi:hypothetical protein
MAITMEFEDRVMADVIHRIEEYAHGRIRGLRVRHDRGQLVLEGFARCFHDKQRAQEAAFSAVQVIGPIANRIEVTY